MPFPDKNYVLGSGRLYFGQFAPDTRVAGPLEYFGNTPEFTTSSESENLDHFDADEGIRVKDDSVLLELTRSGAFTTDHISPGNLAKWFLGAHEIVTQAAIVSAEHVIDSAVLGRRYQIGETLANPMGVRGLSSVSAANTTAGSVALVANTDFTYDADTGGFVLLATSVLVDDGDEVTITYSAAATTYNEIQSGNSAQVEGRLFFEATNPKGLKFDYLWPYASLKPDGDFSLKGTEEWQTLGFTVEFLKLDAQTQVVYIRGRAGVGV